MWDSIDAEYQYASIYYILFILLGPFVLVNVFVAAISAVFLQLRRRNQVRRPKPPVQVAISQIAEDTGGALCASSAEK